MTALIYIFRCLCGYEWQEAREGHDHPLDCQCPNCGKNVEPYQADVFSSVPRWEPADTAARRRK